MKDKTLGKLMNPKLLKKHLMLASLYLTGYELLKSSIIDDVKRFFYTGFNEKGFTYSAEYEKKSITMPQEGI